MKRRNPMARAVRTCKFRLRVVKAKKGKGSYVRRPKHAGRRHEPATPLRPWACFHRTPGEGHQAYVPRPSS